MPNTRLPVPVSSVITACKLELLGVVRNVAIPEPNPLIPVLTGNPVALTRLPQLGVPMFGVISTAFVLNTRLPVPVSSVTVVRKLELLGVVRNVAIPEPNPLIPVLTGNPVALTRLPQLGVPMFGVISTAFVLSTRLPVPVSSVITACKLELLGVVRNVAIPEPNPLIPVLTGNPVALTRLPQLGVPILGVIISALVLRTTLPVPVTLLLKSEAEI